MLKVYSCIADAHDLKLVGLAAVVCALASYAAINLLRHAQKSSGQTRDIWLAVSAISTGFGIWATHFIAMLAFTPGIPSGYNILLTMSSLVAAILLTGIGLAVAVVPNWRHAQWVGGAIVAGGIAAMHYIGMAAFEIEGTISWDPALVVASIVFGGVLGAIALPAGLHGKEEKWKIGGAVLLTLAICSHHFTAMGAVSITPDPTIVVSRSALPAGWLAVGVALASFAIIGLALAGVVLDIRDKRRSELETDHMRDLANASVEGLLVCDGEIIVSVNTSFAHLTGLSAADLVGARLESCFPDKVARLKLLSSSNQLVETNLQQLDGSTTPVELILRPIIFAGRPHHVIAVRDLQARKEAEEHIHYLAHHDPLTSLPNRGYFNARIDQEIATLNAGESFAVLCLDLDRFKEVNDLFGHAAGDNVLQTVASRVTAVLTGRQVMARLGGDEFAILVPEITNPAMASRLAEAVLKALRVKSDAPETNSISTSIGIALYPDDAVDRQTLLIHADTALYRAKAEGRNTYRFFEARMGAEVRERRMIEHDLRHAIARDELRLVFQPQKDIQNGTIIGFEALLRWRHPLRGEISPDVFIPIAEESDAIIDIGAWVLRTACREAATWTKPLMVAVNVSAVQLYNTNFVSEVHQILLDTGLPARRLELEITETALVRDFNRALAALRLIKTLGVHIAMDDFGTGYSSLSNLRAFPFDKIKIDGSFVRAVNSNGQSATIVRAVLGLGRGLGLPVLAEGVETSAEMQFLRDEECKEVQGYFVARPADIASFRSLTHGDVRDDVVQDLSATRAQRA
ncbi:EAL domain-containing protein [Roseiarcaceae bacterium H3SJ34-1]|uniref:bifunctional diguanylate cyclase/phosphodiesterase n=1 Tax=Terripilifer ovatus TaxID=3032367 RepID=UPI003AB95EF2|nr:EAL domain-containing protein [Roseiarcaceae bacterium H3SJ34-1]